VAVLIKEKDIEHFIEKIPPTPEALKSCVSYLKAAELTKAAKAAEADPALSAYLRNLVNKPIYGFKNEVTKVSQIFGILGVAKAQQAVYAYMMSLLSPDEWKLFSMNKKRFYDLQADLNARWQHILKHLQTDDREIESAIALLPASIIVSEALFSQKLDDVRLLRSVDEIDYNTILQRLCKMDLFDIAEKIAHKWEMEERICTIVQAASGIKPAQDEKLNLYGQWMHLLLFYTLSQPNYIEAELNDFIEFKIEYVSEIYEEFAQLMEIA
jgi:HD-like signal output (HDOD) protein